MIKNNAVGGCSGEEPVRHLKYGSVFDRGLETGIEYLSLIFITHVSWVTQLQQTISDTMD